jgi:hypothetical protein
MSAKTNPRQTSTPLFVRPLMLNLIFLRRVRQTSCSGERARLARAGDHVLAIANFRCALFTIQKKRHWNKDCFGGTPKPARETRALPRIELDARRWAFFGRGYGLNLIPQPLLVAMRPHPFAALVLGNFCFPSFFKRAHSDLQISQVAIQPFNGRYCNCVSSPNCCRASPD